MESKILQENLGGGEEKNQERRGKEKEENVKGGKEEKEKD